MTTRQLLLTKGDIEELVYQFADSVIAQDKAIAHHDSKTGSKFARKYIKGGLTPREWLKDKTLQQNFAFGQWALTQVSKQ